MAKSDWVIKTSEYRLCLVDNRKAFFHRWEDRDDLIVKFNTVMKHDDIRKALDLWKDSGYLPTGSTSEKVRRTLAIVEYEDGTIDEVDPSKLHFLDSEGKFDEFYWGPITD